MKKCKYLVLGAGVSGLYFSTQIKNEDYLIIEKDSSYGGYCKTFRCGEYIWDYAGHFFHFSNSELKEKFKKVLNSEDTVKKNKNTKILYKNSYIDYPFQKNIHQLQKEEMIECLVGLFEKEDKYDNFLNMLYSKFGMGITEKFLKPYNEKLYACDLNKLDIDAMGRFFPYADIKDIILNMKKQNNNSYNQIFFYPKKGAQIYIDTLIKDINTERLLLNEIIKDIDITNKIIRTNYDTYKFEYLISSIPLNIFSELSHLDINKEIFSYNKVLVFNLGFDKPSKDKDVHWIYIPDKEINFYRAGFYNNIIDSEKLSMYIEIGFSQNEIIDIEKEFNETIKNLKKLNIIDDTYNLNAYNQIVMNPAYVHITNESINIVKNLKKKLEESNIFLIGRYGQWKYCSIEDCMLDSIQILNKIKESK